MSLSLLSRAEAGMAPSSASQLAPRPVPSAPPRQGLLIAKKRSGGALLGPGRRFAEGGTVSHGAEVPICAWFHQMTPNPNKCTHYLRAISTKIRDYLMI